MKVIFDFDDVIFDAKRFKVAMFQILREHGYETVEEQYESIRKNEQPFSIHDFIHTLDTSLTSERQESLYQKILAVSEHVTNPEVVDIMKSVGKENSYIVTSGDYEFQMDKIRRSIGLDSVQEILVVPGSKKEVIEFLCKKHESEEVIFVDDKNHFINDIDMEQCPNLKTVLFNGHGVENLEAEITESQRMGLFPQEIPDPKQPFKMR